MFLVFFQRQVIGSARTDAGSCFRANNTPVRMLLHDLLIMHRLIVEPRNVHLICQLVLDRASPVVEGRGSGARGVLFMEKTRQPLGFLPAVWPALFGNLIADAPHDDAGMIAVTPNHVAN